MGRRSTFREDGTQEAEVVDNKEVRFQGRHMSLTKATSLAYEAAGIDLANTTPIKLRSWLYLGRLLIDIRNELDPH